MRFVRPITSMDDLIGGLARQTRTELLCPTDLIRNEPVYERVHLAAVNALAQELNRPDSDLPNFIARRTTFGNQAERHMYENFWAIHLSEGPLRNCLPLDNSYNWPRALGFAQQVVMEAVFAELREEGLI